MSLHVRIEIVILSQKKRKQNPSQEDDASTAEGTIAGSGWASKVRHVQQSPARGGPHRDHILHVPTSYPCENQTENPGKDAILPVVPPQFTARVLGT